MTAQSNRADERRLVDGKELQAASVDEHQARAAAGITMALGATAFVYANFHKLFWPIRAVSAFFFVDFLVRVTLGLERSPCGLAARWMTHRQPPQWVSAEPKRFAWTMGLVMALAMTVITKSGTHGPLPRTICLICLALMWMEAVLGVCVGCEIYGLMVQRGWRAPSDAFEVCAGGACALAVPDAPLAASRRPITRDAFVGTDQVVPLFDGSVAPFVNLDNAASTPAFRSVLATIEEFLPFSAGVHRGTGYKSRLSTKAFERAREMVGDFFGADPERDVVVFAKNTTEAINNLVRSLPINADSMVLTTLLEHHSNDLPWRGHVRTACVGARPDGTLDLDHLDRLLREHAGRIALLAVSGVSNVTGVVQPVHLLAEMVHSAGGRVLVDAAQLAPHRSVALAAATRALTEIGLDRIAAHEIELTQYATQRLSELPGLTIHGPAAGVGPDAKVGVIPFTIAGIDHGLIAAVLGYEHGVGVRNGCFCAHPYIGHLLRIDRAESRAWVGRARSGDKRGAPGMVRISFGCYNDMRDVDVAVAALEH